MIDPDNYDWSKFEITYYYNAHITRVFRMWIECQGLESFLIARCVYTDPEGNVRDDHEPPQLGDSFDWQFRHDYNLTGTITAFEDKKRFSFTFGDMLVDIFFRVLDDRTEVHLVQSNIPDTNEGRVNGHLNCRSCWVFFMTNLTAKLMYGRDLRHRDTDLVASMEVGYVPMTQRAG